MGFSCLMSMGIKMQPSFESLSGHPLLQAYRLYSLHQPRLLGCAAALDHFKVHPAARDWGWGGPA